MRSYTYLHIDKETYYTNPATLMKYSTSDYFYKLRLISRLRDKAGVYTYTIVRVLNMNNSTPIEIGKLKLIENLSSRSTHVSIIN